MRTAPLALIALALAACAPAVPDSGAGVGFQDYDSYIARQRALAAAPPVAAPPVVTPGFDPASAAAAIDRAEGRAAPAPVTGAAIGALPAVRPRGNAPAGIAEQSGEMVHATPAPAAVTPVPATPGTPGISDEQDFQAVAARETIESDRARIERNRAQYVVVQPRDLPQRPGDTGPNLVDYALATTNPPGTPLYSRRSLVRKDPLAACARFTSPDIAQQEFLREGGPQRDRLGVDPDGDGFACDWDPRPFRAALQ
jgi:hypothetical protein